MSFNELRDRVTKTAEEHGFKHATVGEDLMLIVTEAAEAMEDHRKGHRADEVWYRHSEDTPDKAKPCGIPSEIADIIVRCLHFCGKHGIDIDKIMQEKMDYNDARPYKHGKII